MTTEKDIPDYLTEEEKKMPLDIKLMQMALGLESCKTVGDAVNLIKEIYEMGREDSRKEIIEEFKLWLDQFEKIVNWHKKRSLLPYDWNDYEHKKIIEFRDKLKEKKQ